MNLILLFQDDFTDERHVRLTGRRYKHARDICRVSEGGEMIVGLCDGKIGSGRIISINERNMDMEVAFYSEPPAALPVTLVLALPRPIMLKRVLATATGMGVKRIILFHSNRVEKSFWESPVLKQENLKEPLVLGLEQARDTVMPTVELKPLFKPFVEDELGHIAEGALRLVAHPAAGQSCPRGVEGQVTLVIGPEGGFIPYEIEKLTDMGFLPVHLGERILRVETAVPVLLSRLF